MLPTTTTASIGWTAVKTANRGTAAQACEVRVGNPAAAAAAAAGVGVAAVVVVDTIVADACGAVMVWRRRGKECIVSAPLPRQPAHSVNSRQPTATKIRLWVQGGRNVRARL